MIPKDKELKLIQIYMYICTMYEQSLKYDCQRYSNNSKPLFSDEEILTIYLFVGHEQKYTKIKDIHTFAKEYLRDWFPNLISYQTFNYRLNRMCSVVAKLTSQLLSTFKPNDCQDDTVIVDSMPIMTCCGGNRTGKVATDITDKGYCSTKNMYYHGLKLHVVGCRREGHLPHPCQMHYHLLQKMTLKSSKGIVSQTCSTKISLLIKYTGAKPIGTRNNRTKTMSYMLQSSLSKVQLKKKCKETELQTTFILKQFHQSENLLGLYSVG